jgi:hypothetical protein
MPNRNPASETQRDFFAFLARAPHLILSMAGTGGDAAAVNAHGRFQLLDLLWPNTDDAKNHSRETVLAFTQGDRLEMADTSEPVVHCHVDWALVRFAWIGARPSTLIGTDKEVVLCAEKDKASRVLSFHVRRWEDLPELERWHREAWIDLEPPRAKELG